MTSARLSRDSIGPPWKDLLRLSEEACKFYQKAITWRFVVHPSMPIPFFGDLKGYWGSRKRVITVGLNPSAEEFSGRKRFARFPGGELVPELIHQGKIMQAAKRGLESVLGYFSAGGERAYERWFRNYRQVLLAMGYDYHPNACAGVVLHTDYVSPLATTKGFSRLEDGQREDLKRQAQGWWFGLLECLDPDVVLISTRHAYIREVVSALQLTPEPKKCYPPASSGKKIRASFWYQKPARGRSKRWFVVDEAPNVYPFLMTPGEKANLGRHIARVL